MMKSLMFFSALAVAFFCIDARAETEKIKAPRGGEIKSAGDGYVEVVSARDSIKIFLYDGSLKAEKQLKDLSLVAEVQRSTSKDHETLDLKPTTGGFAAQFDSKDTSKYYLDIGIANRRSGSADRVSFDIVLPNEEMAADAAKETKTALAP